MPTHQYGISLLEIGEKQKNLILNLVLTQKKRTMKATTIEELGKGIKNGESSIEITIDLKNKVFTFKKKTQNLGSAAWATAIASIATAVGLYLSAPATTAATAPVGGAGGVISFTGGTVAAAGAVTILGVSATTFAIGLGVAAGGVGAITRLVKDYEIVERYGNYYLEKK